MVISSISKERFSNRIFYTNQKWSKMLFYGTSDEHRPNMMKWVNQVKLELYLNMSSLCWRFVISINWHKCAYVIRTFFLYIPFTDFMWYTIIFRTVSSHYSRKLYWKKQNGQFFDRTDNFIAFLCEFLKMKKKYRTQKLHHLWLTNKNVSHTKHVLWFL